MLSRTAAGLFWMSRYVERAENMARLLDAGRRMDGLPNSEEVRCSEWASIVIASGCKGTFPHALETATGDQVAEHLIFDKTNPSSIYCCLQAARENARAMRIAVTRECWDALSEAWGRMRHMSSDDIRGGRLAGFLDWVKAQGATFRGAAEASMLRDESYTFIQLGKLIERADATARLLDVKYHVLLPTAEDVGGGLDHMQWVQLLRAANSLRAFRWIYRDSVSPEGVVDFLALNAASPRSIRHCYGGIVDRLEDMKCSTSDQRVALEQARKTLKHLEHQTVADLIEQGLHEWLTCMIGETNDLAVDIAVGFGFTSPVQDENAA